MITYRWLKNDEIEAWVQPVIQQRGWALLNINDERPSCRVLGAFDGIEFVGFLVLQMHPVIGPAWSDALHRRGEVSRELADRMHAFLEETHTRGAITICESPVSERLAQRHGMKPVEYPVYEWIGV